MKILFVAYDNGMYINQFPQGVAYIAAVLVEAGHQVEIYSQDKNHWPESHLTAYLDRNKFDVVGAGVIAGYYQYRKLLKISEAINRSINRPFYILGGHGPSPEPDYFLKKTGADAVVLGEGEVTIIELCRALEDKLSLSSVKGIAYRQRDKTEINERRELISDIDKIPFPAYQLFPIDYYRLVRSPHATNNDFVMPVLSGRGCVFQCTFCYRMDKGFRPRSSESIIEEIKLLNRDYGINYVIFSDELLMTSSDRTKLLCEDFIRSGINFKWWCNGRLNFAQPDLLKLMKRAGCVFINYGIESMDNMVLKNYHKGLTTDMIIKGVEETYEAGISPGLNIIFGGIGDNKETIKKSVDFLLKYDRGAEFRTIRPVTPYPGSPLYYTALEKGLLKSIEDFYENKHVNSDLLSVNFTEMSDEEFYSCLKWANSVLSNNYYEKQKQLTLERINKLYNEKDAQFRGFRQT